MCKYLLMSLLSVPLPGGSIAGRGQLLAELCLQNGQLLIFSLEAERWNVLNEPISLNRKTHPLAPVSGTVAPEKGGGRQGAVPPEWRGAPVRPPGAHQPTPGKDGGEGGISDMEKIWGKAEGKAARLRGAQ